ncbi:MAG TPA: universal stress protein [Kofleriaceae bacterium]|nr:universal stress protein [Kofleriaceae bacterium]
MKKIAVGIDFSPESTLAARQAVAIARHLGAEVVLVHAQLFVELPHVGPEPEAQVRAAVDSYRSLLARELEESRTRLGELRTSLAGQGVEVSQVLVEGATDEALCSAARELGADLFAVGTHGRTGLRWFFLGSVAQRVVRHSPVDVLVARREGAGAGGFKSALVATDFSPPSVRALERALQLVSPRGRIDVVHCLPYRPIGLWTEGVVAWDVELEAALEQNLRAQGEALVAPRRREGGPALEFHLLREPPAPGIVHWLETRPCDLAVLGSHGRKGLRRAVLGSVAEAVVRRAPCSVLVARADAG